MTSIFDIFKPATPAAAGTPGAPAAAATTNPTVPNASTVPAQAGTTPEGGTPASPMDNYAKLWETDPNAAKTNTPAAPDPKKFLEVAKQTDFSKVLNPETMKKIAAGGDEAMAAMSESMNLMAQAVYAQSAHASMQMTQEAVKRAQADMLAQIPELVKRTNVSNDMLESNPILSHPSTAPIISALNKQFATKYPAATAAELKRMTNEYITNFAKGILPNNTAEGGTQGKTSQGRVQENWDNFFQAPQ